MCSGCRQRNPPNPRRHVDRTALIGGVCSWSVALVGAWQSGRPRLLVDHSFISAQPVHRRLAWTTRPVRRLLLPLAMVVSLVSGTIDGAVGIDPIRGDSTTAAGASTHSVCQADRPADHLPLRPCHSTPVQRSTGWSVARRRAYAVAGWYRADFRVAQCSDSKDFCGLRRSSAGSNSRGGNDAKPRALVPSSARRSS